MGHGLSEETFTTFRSTKHDSCPLVYPYNKSGFEIVFFFTNLYDEKKTYVFVVFYSSVSIPKGNACWLNM